ncbi:MAG: hypothetical protein SGI90_15400 [Candidatus Eisenbacteria bacterium]|nr:hypothetical protein [Candidatus Eisenbacteria bacterium]
MTIRYGVLVSALAVAVLIARKPPVAQAAGGIGDAYITSDASDIVRAYAGATGAFLGNHCASVNAIGQLGIHFGTSNGRFLVGAFGGGVDEFNAASGAYMKTYSPGGGVQWAGLYVPSGNVYIGSWNTNDVREYDATTGAFIRVVCPALGFGGGLPSDMRIGPNGNLYICLYGDASVIEVDVITGAPINQWPVPGRPNDIAFIPGEILVTSMGLNNCQRFDSSSLAPLGAFVGTGWDRPHGIDIGPSDGLIYIVDGVTTQVHVFDPVTFLELNANWRAPDPEDKIVDIEFRRFDQPTPVKPVTWSKVKTLFQ